MSKGTLSERQAHQVFNLLVGYAWGDDRERFVADMLAGCERWEHLPGLPGSGCAFYQHKMRVRVDFPNYGHYPDGGASSVRRLNEKLAELVRTKRFSDARPN